MKHKLILILVSAVIISGMASCSSTSSSPTPRSDVSPHLDSTATVVPTAKPAPTDTAAQLRTATPVPKPAPTDTAIQLQTVTPLAKPTPTEAVTRFRTVVPITQTEPSVEKDKTNMNGTPIPLPLDPSLEKIVMQAKEDLAKRLAINIDQISLVELQSVTWPNGSLGCPQPGMVYIQVEVDGLLIRLSAGGKLYEYHSGGSRVPFLCQPNR